MPGSGPDYAVGAALTLLVDVLWTSSNYLANTVLTHGYDKPFAVTYLSTASFITGLQRPSMPARPSSIDGRRRKTDLAILVDAPESSHRSLDDVIARGRSRDSSSHRGEEQHLCASSVHSRSMYGSDSESEGYDVSNVEIVSASELPPLSIIETAILSMEFAIIWFVANWTFVAALAYTSVASGTTLGSTSGFFTLILGSMFGVEAFSMGKLISVFTSFTGVALVAWADHDAPHSKMALSNPILGDFLALVSAMCYAGYVTLLKVRIGSEDRISMPLFLGFVGAFNLLAFWPIGLLLHWLGIELLSLPQDRLMWSGVLVNMAITVVSDFAYLLAMLKSSPLFTTIGLSLTIPMAVFGDAAMDPTSLTIQSAAGSILVLLSFAGIAWEENRSSPEQEYDAFV
ncbi:vacuolar membrane protein [Malassezia pachydermatis]|uniref:Vacuolar membrane protein n=1 Tax=Malassezia pachydermatis TaxID=77020 RepID=A0A0M8MNT1_9BASI|nr:vacuolar membrane protein [Malassezia pachydermatis]KOS15298.1 vacuolar membrane protein [Malassezia pachydermatis]